MNETGAGRPAARAITPSRDSSEGAVSTARLVTPRAEQVSASVSRLADGDWASLGTAPTLLLTPPQQANGDDATPSTAVTTPAMLEEQPWYRTGNTVPPPSMRPPTESVAPAPIRNPPNPRVLKIVAGIFAGCLFIVAVAGMKVVYFRLRGPVGAPAPTAQSSSPAPLAVVAEATSPTPPARERALGATPPEATTPSSAQPSQSAPVARTAPTRTSPSPSRVTAKPSTRRAPASKKVGRIH